MTQSSLAFSDLVSLADYVLVEADGAKMLPLKAHAEYEPVIPDCASLVVCVAGIDGVGLSVSETCHRPDVLLINKVEAPAQWRMAERIAFLCNTPVVAGSLKNGEFRCLR